MALQQNKSVGMVANTMTITNLVNQSETSGAKLKMIAQPMLLEPVAIGMKMDEPVLLAKVNDALMEMDKAGEIDAIWAKWLGPNTSYKLTRDEHVQKLSAINFTPIP
jgi:polar amino acid transport system substrate-binding protein